MTDITLKQGETFNLLGQYTENDGTTPKSLVGITLTSQIRDASYGLIVNLTVTILDAAGGTYSITSPTNTLTWKAGTHLWDIKEEKAGVIICTTTSHIVVEKAVTHV
jgi:hypothetical protein